MTKQNTNNRGFALTGVIVLIAVMTIFGTSMYVFSMQALKILEYGTDRQKAEYLARSGIEAAVFMYQDTLLNVGNDDDELNVLGSFIDKSSDDKNETTDETIKTNWVYMIKGKSKIANSDNYEIRYVSGGSGEEPVFPQEEIAQGHEYVGCFRVEISNETKTAPQLSGDLEEEGGERVEYIKRFKSIAYVGDKAASKNAYIVPVVDISHKNWVDDDGIIRLVNLTPADSDENSIIYQTTVTMDCGAIDKLASKLHEWFGIGESGSRVSNVNFTLGITTGNMVVTMPKNSKTLSYEYIDTGSAGLKKDNMAGFVSMNTLFIEPGIDMIPDKSRFNFLFLRGNEIVIDNPIELYIYDPGINYSKDESSGNFIVDIISKTQALIAKISKNYRLGTVVIGTSNQSTSTVIDPMPKVSGGLGNCGKVFFGGDVYVNFMSTQGSRKYKLFSSGDIFYFNGDFVAKYFDSGDSGGKDVPYGIDLVKYFLDTAKSRGYSGTVLQQFERTRDFYYDNVQSVYTTDDMRKIEVGANSYDEIDDIIIPSSGDTSYIIWD